MKKLFENMRISAQLRLQENKKTLFALAAICVCLLVMVFLNGAMQPVPKKPASYAYMHFTTIGSRAAYPFCSTTMWKKTDLLGNAQWYAQNGNAQFVWSTNTGRWEQTR